MKNILKKLNQDQRGVASMIIAIFVMLILSLVVLTITRDANREQRQALDRQLNSQAFYAAESGINDTVNYFVNGVRSGGGIPSSKDDCKPAPDATAPNQLPGYNSSIGSDGASYTCAMYRLPSDLQFDNTSTTNSVIVPVQPTKDVASLEITWKSTQPPIGSPLSFSGCPDFIDGSKTIFSPERDFPKDNCDAGFMRVELADTRGSISRSSLSSGMFVGFFVPRDGGGATSVKLDKGQGNGKGVVRETECTNGLGGTPDGCKMTITGLDLRAGETVYLRLRPIYKTAHLKVAGIPVNAGDNILFENAQLIVDVTGKSSDVLKRIQARVSLTRGVKDNNNSDADGDLFPEFAIQADSICKRLNLVPSGISDVNSSDEC